MCIQRNRLIPLTIWIMGGGVQPPMDYGSGKSPMDEMVKYGLRAPLPNGLWVCKIAHGLEGYRIEFFDSILFS